MNFKIDAAENAQIGMGGLSTHKKVVTASLNTVKQEKVTLPHFQPYPPAGLPSKTVRSILR